jgi:hypothetical protein
MVMYEKSKNNTALHNTAQTQPTEQSNPSMR